MSAFPLKTLQARLQKVVKVTTEEIETEGDSAGKYVFRSDDGEKHMWSPRPYTFHFHNVESLSDADHIVFLCPMCFEKNGGAKRTHQVFVSFAGRDIPLEAGSINNKGQPSRWNVSGSGLDDLVLTPSILIGGPCAWHGYIGSSGIPAGHAG